MNKKYKHIVITLIGCGDTPTEIYANDTDEEPFATNALNDFKAEKQMHFKAGGYEYYVPFHAVDHVEVTESSEAVEDRPNPY